MKTQMWLFTAYEIYCLFPQIWNPSLDILPVTSSVILGFLLAIIGGLGRIWCFRTLGKFFTFKVTIRDSHKLIQAGPYAYVRHPSYTFATILIIGMFFIHRRFFNLFENRLYIDYIFNPVIQIIIFGLGAFIGIKRIRCEEAELSKTFGNEWLRYVQKTKRFLPKLI